VIQYRTFRNDDPPALVAIWNEAFTGRGTVALRATSPLEYFVFAKPYFDPAGLIIAADGRSLVGFVHAGFGPNAERTAVSCSEGVVCLIGVRTAYQRKGVGSELLRRAEEYLRGRGAHTLTAGPMAPLDPFYFGLYGGSESAGFLLSDRAAEPFLLRHGYQPADGAQVFQRRLASLNVADGRFPGLRRRYDVRLVARTGVGTWWQECELGPLEVHEFRLEDKQSGEVAARAGAWEMQGFSQRWNEAVVGLVDVQVKAELRRQGLGKFLLAGILRHLQEQYFSVVEVHARESNAPAIALFRSVGMEPVDRGRMYRRQS
jgi:ribosomal protein S18 acetylase RimI-like enzyme